MSGKGKINSKSAKNSKGRKSRRNGKTRNSSRSRSALVGLLCWLAVVAAAVTVLVGNEKLAADIGLLFSVMLGVGLAAWLLWFFAARAYRRVLRRDKARSMRRVDAMTGTDFEAFCAGLLRGLGYTQITATKATGDQGADLIACKDGLRYSVQCKRYDAHVGNKAVQEAFAGKTHYGCDLAIVITNSYFTKGAVDLAQSTDVLLWDRDFLVANMKYFPI